MSALALDFSGGRELVLRPYQRETIDAIKDAMDRRVERMLVVSATGTGKTAMFSGLVRDVCNDEAFTVLILAHRKELLDQTRATIEWVCPGLPVEIHSGEFRAKVGAQVVIASVQSLGTRQTHEVIEWLRPRLVICDEAHHAAAETYQNVFRNAGCYSGKSMLVGVTATPHRLDKLALVGPENKAVFQEVVYRYDITAAVRDGYLVDPKGYRSKADFNLDDVKIVHGDYAQGALERAMNTDPLNELAFKSWHSVAGDRRSIVFCAGVDHAKAMAEVYRAHGVAAEAVWGDMSKPSREKAIESFRSGSVQVLTNMDILTEGFDARECGCVMLLRPTKSWSLYTQMVGRGLRPLGGVIDDVEDASGRRAAIAQSSKPNCIVIDIVSASAEHDLTAKKSGKGAPSLQALVGLPDGLDLEGRTISEAVEEFEQLPEEVKAAAFRRPTSFSGLKAVLTQIELISSAGVPDEAKEAGAQFFWFQSGEYEYRLNCGAGNDGVRREAFLVGDEVGRWTVGILGTHDDPNRCSALEVDLGQHDDLPFQRAESVLAGHLPHRSLGLIRADAAWRTAPMTAPQAEKLRALGVDDEILRCLDRGHASALITNLSRRAN